MARSRFLAPAPYALIKGKRTFTPHGYATCKEQYQNTFPDVQHKFEHGQTRLKTYPLSTFDPVTENKLLNGKHDA